jgi:NADH-quinone oxidoreductase E subunit
MTDQKLKLLARYPRERTRLLSLLHELQRANPNNYLTGEDLRLVADYLNLPLSEVHDAATFYSLFSLKPRGKHVIRLCKSPPCHLAGAWSLLAALERELGITVGETTPDGLFTLETTSCLGVCGVAPAMMIDEEVYGRLTPDRLREILASYRGEA